MGKNHNNGNISSPGKMGQLLRPVFNDFWIVIGFASVITLLVFFQFQNLFVEIDNSIHAVRMSNLSRSPTGSIVVVEIDSDDTEKPDGRRWSRSMYGQLVSRLFMLGATEIAFDLDFSAHSTRIDDQKFLQSLENASGPVTLAAFLNPVTKRPLPVLEMNAWIAASDIVPDQDGLVRGFSYTSQLDDQVLLSFPSVLGDIVSEKTGGFKIDFGILVNEIPSYSANDFLNGTIDAGAFRGKKVIIGIDANGSSSGFRVPVYGILTGTKLLVVAAESILQNRALQSFSVTAVIYGALAIFLLGVATLPFSKLRTKILIFVLASLGIELTAFIIQKYTVFIADTALWQFCLYSVLVMQVVSHSVAFSKQFVENHRKNKSIASLLGKVVSDSLSGIIVANEAGTVLHASRKARALMSDFGFDLNCGSIYRNLMPTEMVNLLDECFSDQEILLSSSLEEIIVRRNGVTRYIEYSITPSFPVSNQHEDKENVVVTLVFHDVTAIRLEQQKTEYLAIHDHKTGLYNKSGFMDKIEHKLLNRTADTCQVFSCKLTRFHRINQALGYEYGDLLLHKVAERISEPGLFEVRARQSFDEFLLFRSGDDGLSTQHVVRELRRAIDRPYKLKGHTTLIGINIGVAEISQCSDDPDELMDAAGVALYRAEEDHMEYCCYSSSMAAEVLQRQTLEHEIIDALTRGEFSLHYQPQADLVSGEIVSCEALLRWHHRDLGYIRPDVFIPILEETGLIAELGRWIFQTACIDASRWPKQIPVAVNVSAVQFQRSNIIEDIQNALATARLPVNRLHIEITESLFIADTQGVTTTLEDMREAGIKVALDDFGTGYSSLGYIQQFPLDQIKIDRAFVQDLPNSAESLAIVEAISILSRGLGMDVIAEGVEQIEQAEVLSRAGCQFGQGWLYGRPMPQDEIVSRLADELRLPKRAQA